MKLLPFQVIPPTLAPQSAGPEAAQGTDETLVVVPAGFLGGIIGGLGGNLLGGAIGGLFGSSDTGGSIGSTVGGVIGGLLPFQVVPPQLMPQSSGPETAPSQDDAMVVVPAGFFGDLLSGVAGTVGHLVGGDTGQKIGEAASPFLGLLPFQTVPPKLAPQSTGPDGTEKAQEMVVLPAGFFGNLLSGFAEDHRRQGRRSLRGREDRPGGGQRSRADPEHAALPRGAAGAAAAVRRTGRGSRRRTSRCCSCRRDCSAAC